MLLAHSGKRYCNTQLEHRGCHTQAKQTLLDAEFVGFYETLHRDFWGLKDAVFPGAINVPWSVCSQ